MFMTVEMRSGEYLHLYTWMWKRGSAHTHAHAHLHSSSSMKFPDLWAANSSGLGVRWTLSSDFRKSLPPPHSVALPTKTIARPLYNIGPRGFRCRRDSFRLSPPSSRFWRMFFPDKYNYDGCMNWNFQHDKSSSICRPIFRIKTIRVGFSVGHFSCWNLYVSS